MNKSINITTLSSLSYARGKNWINIAVKGVINQLEMIPLIRPEFPVDGRQG